MTQIPLSFLEGVHTLHNDCVWCIDYTEGCFQITNMTLESKVKNTARSSQTPFIFTEGVNIWHK